ncbi:MAG: nucleotidyltransferase domain-containing protein [Nanoarchaeota archaeon]
MEAKSIKDRIKEYFFVNPTVKLRVRQIERELKNPLPSVIRYTKELEKEKILKKSEIGNVVFYSGDRSSKNFLLEKKLFNIQSLYSSEMIDFLIMELSNPAIIVFGSYAKGEDVENSDIDLYIETPSKKEIKLEKFGKILKRKIQIFFYKNIHEIKNIDLANNIINGIILNGFIEVLK